MTFMTVGRCSTLKASQTPFAIPKVLKMTTQQEDQLEYAHPSSSFHTMLIHHHQLRIPHPIVT